LIEDVALLHPSVQEASASPDPPAEDASKRVLLAVVSRTPCLDELKTHFRRLLPEQPPMAFVEFKGGMRNLRWYLSGKR
jgi:hypothetical protein